MTRPRFNRGFLEVEGGSLRLREPWSSVRDGTINRKPLMALLLLGPVLAGCNSASDLLTKDADWFSRSGRVFIRNVSIETPPLSPNKPVGA